MNKNYAIKKLYTTKGEHLSPCVFCGGYAERWTRIPTLSWVDTLTPSWFQYRKIPLLRVKVCKACDNRAGVKSFHTIQDRRIFLTRKTMNKLIPGSYSKLSTYEQCPAKAKYRYIDLLPDRKSPQAQRGTDLHASAEQFLLGKTTKVRKELAPLAETLVKVRKSEPQVEVKMAFSITFRHTLDFYDKGAWFRSVLDSVYADPDTSTLHIQEWKSGKEYDDHYDQRATYGALSLVQWPDYRQAEVTTYYIDQGFTRPLLIDHPRASLVLAKLNQRLERMGNDSTFYIRPGRHCNWCPFNRKTGGPCNAGQVTQGRPPINRGNGGGV